jgi:hypothetical protein
MEDLTAKEIFEKISNKTLTLEDVKVALGKKVLAEVNEKISSIFLIL